MASISRAWPEEAGSGASSSSRRLSMRLAMRSSFAVRSMLRRKERRLESCGADPNTTLLLTATGGYKAVGTAIQAAMGAKRPAKNRHPWLRRVGLAVLLIMAGLLLSIIAFRFINPPVT